MSSELLKKWGQVTNFISERFEHKQPDLNAILFIIGVREFGVLLEKNFSKDEKVSLMHIATCKILSYSGYYELEGIDTEGWPQWKSIKSIPILDISEQELFLKQHIIEYFDKEEIIAF
ncbi:MAG: hypothetical protein KF882_06440 [Bacteroidia bacterium]|nr:hypothetical protein [Bacteroidia bacterium]MCO5255066.1 hypothetical protein [Bacteroidota bacterium]